MRILISVIGFLGVIFGPWYVPLVCMIMLSLRWPALETVLIGLCMDFVWQGSFATTTGFFSAMPFFTLGGVILLWIFEPLRNRLLIF